MSAPSSSNTLLLNRYSNAREFADLVMPTMVRREAANCLQLGLLDGMLAGLYEDPYLATVSTPERKDAPLLNVIQTPPYRLILGEPSSLAPELDDLLGPLLSGLPGDLPGVIGPVQISARFAELYAARHGLEQVLSMSERVHQCTRVVMPVGVPGNMVRATPQHADLLVRWWRAFNAEAVPNEPDRAVASVQRDLHAEPGGLWLWQVDGEPVALAGARGPTPNGIRIGPVYTPPDKRRNGYAAALVGSLTQKLLNEGREFVFLFTNLANPTANALYRRLGYVGVADRSMHDFKTSAA